MGRKADISTSDPMTLGYQWANNTNYLTVKIGSNTFRAALARI